MKKNQLRYAVTTLWILSFAITLFNISVNAYVWTGDKWPDNKIDPLYYWDFSGYSEFHTSASDWRAAPVKPNPLQHPGDPEYAYFYVHKVFEETDWWGATVTITDDGIILAADVYLNEYHFQNAGSGSRRSTCAHEIGHVLGLDEEPNAVLRALMYPYHNVRWDSWRINTPQTDDVNGVNSIYGAP